MAKPPVFTESGKQICGAKNRSGKECSKHPVPGKNRCHLHGGYSPETNKNAQKHGIYSSTLTAEEQEIEQSMAIGVVEDELKICKIRLLRALKAEREAIDSGEMLQIDSKSEEPHFQTGEIIVKKTYKRTDFSAIIDRLMSRIESLEKTRSELAANASGVSDLPVSGVTVTVQHAKP